MSRLSEELNQLKTEQGLTNPQIVERARQRGAKLSLGNVSNYLTGKHPEKPNRSTLVAFALALNVPSSRLVRAAMHTGREPFTPDPSADRLTPPQRAVLNELIRVMTDANEKAGDGDVEATPISDAGGKPATGEDDGLGAFGHRGRGDLDHEAPNDGAGDNVRELHPDPEKLAAYKPGKITEKERQDLESEKRDSESQDPEDWK